MRGNTAELNGGAGFDVDDFFAPAAQRLLLEGNTASGNAGAGIEINPTAVDTQVIGNVASGNGPDFCDQGTATVVMGNDFGTVGACVTDD